MSGTRRRVADKVALRSHGWTLRETDRGLELRKDAVWSMIIAPMIGMAFGLGLCYLLSMALFDAKWNLQYPPQAGVLPWSAYISASPHGVSVDFVFCDHVVRKRFFEMPLTVVIRPAYMRGDWGFAVSLRDEKHPPCRLFWTIIGWEQSHVRSEGDRVGRVIADSLGVDVEFEGWKQWEFVCV